jgi:hypothetical protein
MPRQHHTEVRTYLALLGREAAMRRILAFAVVVALVMIVAAPAFAAPGKPTFSPAIYADGQAWGTKGNGSLPAPNEHDAQSYDRLFLVPGQLPVSEAGPGNPMYNGGRWWTVQVEWNSAPYLLTSYEDVMDAIAAGDLAYTAVQSPAYFQCPLLPTK